MRYMFIISLQVMRIDNSSALILETSNLMNINLFGEYFRTSGQKTTRDFGGEHSIPPPFLLCPSQKNLDGNISGTKSATTGFSQ